eukprot:scaffold25970_cov73-Cyclotella_meneghiniana.AAC.5
MVCTTLLFIIIIKFLLSGLTTGLALSNRNVVRPKTAPPLQVWDDVLPHADQRRVLHELAAENGLGHACFSRPIKNREDRNAIELALDAILTEIENADGSYDSGNVSKKHYVEYWEAHADVDENLAKVHGNQAPSSDELYTKYPLTYQPKAGGYRYPINGHVLYLQVGTDVKGPTVVFPGFSSGGDLYHGRQKEIGECVKDKATMNETKEVQMISIPAVAGRLLRFNGQDIHAVPRPYDLWLLPFVSGSSDFEPVDQWGRSVILFNIWPADEEPPLDVPLDLSTKSDQPPGTESLCNKYLNWKSVPISQPQEDIEATDPNGKQSVKIWLVGNERRRDYAMRTVPLLCPQKGGQDIVRRALAEENMVTELRLRAT